MKKFLLLVSLLLTVIVVLGVLIFKRSKCSDPAETIMHLTVLECLIKIDSSNIREEICESLGKGKDCALHPKEDLSKIDDFIKNKTITCVKQNLEGQNFCTSGVEEYVSTL